MGDEEGGGKEEGITGLLSRSPTTGQCDRGAGEGSFRVGAAHRSLQGGAP